MPNERLDSVDHNPKEVEEDYLNYLIKECRERFHHRRTHEEIEDADDFLDLCMRINKEVFEQACEDCENLPSAEVELEKYKHLLDQAQWWL
jgi:hypothetical protein